MKWKKEAGYFVRKGRIEKSGNRPFLENQIMGLLSFKTCKGSEINLSELTVYVHVVKPVKRTNSSQLRLVSFKQHDSMEGIFEERA